MNNQTVLVVGGAGFIGSYVNKMLNQAGYQTIILDNLSTGFREVVRYGTFIEGDLADVRLLDQIFNSFAIDAVMHFAACIDVGESAKNPAKYYENNVINTLHLLSSMLRWNVKNFIFSSTAAIYGFPLEPLITEEHPCLPINPYGETKWMIEKIVRDFEKAYDFKFCCLRYFNAAGGDPEGEIKNFQRHTPNLIPRILLSLKNSNGFVTINGTDYPTADGTCIRDYIHIADLGAAHLTALQKLLVGFPSNAYNLGSGKGYSVKEVIQTVENVLDQKIQIVEGKRRLGDPPSLLADSKKATQDLNWQPFFTLEKMIEHAWNAYPPSTQAVGG